MLAKERLKRFRLIATLFGPERTLRCLEAIRKHELTTIIGLLPPRGRVLEIGAGTGWQAQILVDRGYEVEAIDVKSTNYREQRVFPITDYDGCHIPFHDETFDVVFSSNVLEHIQQLYEFQGEIHRVLKPDGRVLHVLPSASWRFWTNITHLLRCWNLPQAHGEHARNAFSEVAVFRRQWWRRFFNETGWMIETECSNKLFYTGHLLMSTSLSLRARERLSNVLGGSCNVFLLKKEARRSKP